MEIETKRVGDFEKIDYKRISELEHFLYTQYPIRLRAIERAMYLGYEPEERKYDLELLAYAAEQELRELKGIKKLPEIKNKKLI